LDSGEVDIVVENGAIKIMPFKKIIRKVKYEKK
jgi:hypothetical protein